MTELEAHFRAVYKPYGFLTDAQWRRLTETSVRRLPDGRVTPHYDPAMVQQFMHHPHDYDLWDEWDRIDIPVLALRGEHSDLLLAETAEAMRQRGPRAVVATIAGCGHAPALNVPEQWALVERFLAGEGADTARRRGIEAKNSRPKRNAPRPFGSRRVYDRRVAEPALSGTPDSSEPDQLLRRLATKPTRPARRASARRSRAEGRR